MPRSFHAIDRSRAGVPTADKDVMMSRKLDIASGIAVAFTLLLP